MVTPADFESALPLHLTEMLRYKVFEQWERKRNGEEAKFHC